MRNSGARDLREFIYNTIKILDLPYTEESRKVLYKMSGNKFPLADSMDIQVMVDYSFAWEHRDIPFL